MPIVAIDITFQSVSSTSLAASIPAPTLETIPRFLSTISSSATVSAMKAPEGVTGNDIKKDMQARGVVIAGGQDRLSGKIFRIGNMGNISIPIASTAALTAAASVQ